MTMPDNAFKGTLAAVRKWTDRGFALFVPESLSCVEFIGRQLPEKSIIAMSIPFGKDSVVPLFMVRRESLLNVGVSHPDTVRMVLASDILNTNGWPTGLVHLDPVRSSDDHMAELLKGILEVVMGEE